MNIEEEAKNYLKAQGDAVEQALADLVCPLLPHYALFWARFIGALRWEGHIEARSIEGLSDLSSEDRPQVEKALDSMWSSHYTLFTHVFSADKKLKYLIAHDGESFNGHNCANYLEAAEEFYFHFGVLLTQLERMWAVTLDQDPDDRYLRTKIRPIIEAKLTGATVAAAIQRVYNDALANARHSIEHYPRTPVSLDVSTGSYHVLLPRKKGESWLEYRARKRPTEEDLLRLTQCVQEDFESLLLLINASYEELTNQLEDFLRKWKLAPTAHTAFFFWVREKEIDPDAPLPSLAAVIRTSTASSVYIEKPKLPDLPPA